jgi:hypothetical protein
MEKYRYIRYTPLIYLALVPRCPQVFNRAGQYATVMMSVQRKVGIYL